MTKKGTATTWEHQLRTRSRQNLWYLRSLQWNMANLKVLIVIWCLSVYCLLLITHWSLYFLAGSDWTPALKYVEIMATIPCRSLLTPSYYHSFGITENYFIFIEQLLKLDIVKMATAYMRGVSWASCMKFQSEDVRMSSCKWVGPC